MMRSPVDLTLTSPQATADFARRLGAQLAPGDCLLLTGPIGAGKTHFARHLIQALLRVAEDVPSPTYTLVQVYDTALGELWHADLYRLTDPDEVIELGLAEAFETAVCLVEWPEKLGDVTPEHALDIRLDPVDDESRNAVLTWSDPKWTQKLDFLADD